MFKVFFSGKHSKIGWVEPKLFEEEFETMEQAEEFIINKAGDKHDLMRYQIIIVVAEFVPLFEYKEYCVLTEDIDFESEYGMFVRDLDKDKELGFE